MGTWNISIDGTGCHHNTTREDIRPSDAEVLAAEFVKLLKAHGHYISSAEFTLIGQHEDLKPKEKVSG